jgi:hypothetical protein
MQTPEKILASATRKIAKWYRAECSYQLLPNGFILKMNGDSQLLPTIGVVGEQLIGSQDDFDAFLDLLGYEGQVERVMFDPSKVKFILDAGWSGKLWRKPTADNVAGKTDLAVSTVPYRTAGKIGAIALVLVAAVAQERPHQMVKRVKNFLRKK